MRRLVLAAAAAAWVLAGCASGNGQQVDAKSGVDGSRQLEVAAADGYTMPFPGTTLPFQDVIAGLASRSSGQLSGMADFRYATASNPQAEQDMVKDLASGAADVAVVPSRAFHDAGLPLLDVLETPFLIGSYDAERALVVSPTADKLLARFTDSGIHPLALAVGPLRRPIVKGYALITPEGWRGKRIRTYFSEVQDDVVRALGATYRHERFDWTGLIEANQLDGAETDVNNVHDRGVGAGFVLDGDIVLWPKIYVIAASQRLWDSLSPTQQQWLTAAAQDARAASVRASWDETRPLQESCAAGLRVAMSSPEERQALHDTVAIAPVMDRLEKDPQYAELEAIASAHPVVPLPAPKSCLGNTPGAASSGPTPSPTGAVLPPFPNGVFRVTVTEAQLIAIGDNNDGGGSGTWKLTVKDDRYQLECVPNTGSQHDCGNFGSVPSHPVEAGTITPLPNGYRVNTVAAMMAAIGACLLPIDPLQQDNHCGEDSQYEVGPAKVTNGQLVVADLDGSSHTWTLNPWKVLG